MHETIAHHSLATLVTCGERGLMANHIPLSFIAGDRSGASHRHLSRANEQWREIASGTEVLSILRGPDAYVSPSAYERRSTIPHDCTRS